MPPAKPQSPRIKRAMEYWLHHPVEAVKAWFQITPEDYQGDMLTDLCVPGTIHTRLAAKSAHGVGKTAFESWVGWHFLLTRGFVYGPETRVVATAPTQPQLMDVLWPEFAKWRLKMPDELKNMWRPSATHIRHVDYMDTWFATARTSNKQENMQGLHGDHILVLCEEASGIDQPIFEVIEGILSNADELGQEALLLLVGNPTQTAGEFYNAFNRNMGLYHRYTITGDPDTKPDRNAGKFYVSRRVSKKYRENMAAKYGRDGAVYDVRVRGIFPREADDVVIPLSWAERAATRTLPPLDAVKHPATIVMDVARFGGDETTLGIYRGGSCVEMHYWPKTSTSQCEDILVDAYFHGAYGVGEIPATYVIVDEPGVGGGVVDGARRRGVPVIPYNGGASLKKDMDSDDDIRMFSNRRSRDWWWLRRKMELGQITIPDDEELINQLASVKYDYVNEKIKVESKKEMRERLGEFASPDRGDNVVMGCAPFLGVHNLTPLEGLDWTNDIEYGEDRATANMDF